MASKVANSNGPLAAGIFADMTVDGPEIGTLVIIVDRAKNLPNRKSVGKQNPYCAARLGKEARKTETDKRGGQTPKWDQELRFTVHDSPDYYNLKISVFSEDKKTDLIGEAWMSLADVIVPGGGKRDLWQGLNCKGRYAGELRVELTYYDSRERPEKAPERMTLAEEMKLQYNTVSKIRRRPLPVNPNEPSATPVNVPDRAAPGRARHGPRDFQTPARANSMPPETLSYPHSLSTLVGQVPVHSQSHHASPITPHEYTPPNQYYGEYDLEPAPQHYEDQYVDGVQQPDFLPQLPPSNRQRTSPLALPNYAQRQLPPSQHRPHSHIGLVHSHSAPSVPLTHPDQPSYHHYQHPQPDFHEPYSEPEYQHHQPFDRRNDVPPGWEDEYRQRDSNAHHYMENEIATPPPPPIHSNSAPAVPNYGSPQSQPPPSVSRYGNTPPHSRPQYVPNSSPLQSIERNYSPQTMPTRGHPPRGRSVDEYGSSPSYHGYDASPHTTPPQQVSPFGRTPPSLPQSHPHSHRHSIADSYGTPSRPHPLSQEISRARSPNPHNPQELPTSSPNGQLPYQLDYRGRDAVPLIKPRALSPKPPVQPTETRRTRSAYNIQHPVRAFESSDQSPLSTSNFSAGGPSPQPTNRATPTRKSVSPRPSTLENTKSTVPFSPDSFDIHNPNTHLGSDGSPRDIRSGPIVGWHGNEIDPSDHLPVDSWAPEPEKKTPTKSYGLGRDRDFGPRDAQSGARISKDTVINVRVKNTPPAKSESQPSSFRNRLTKKSRSPLVEPLREHENFNSVPNPYEQRQQPYSEDFLNGSPGMGGRYDGGGPPNLPPKVPLGQHNYDYDNDALSREISNIDIGTGRNRAAPVAYVPVRSHRERHSFY